MFDEHFDLSCRSDARDDRGGAIVWLIAALSGFVVACAFAALAMLS